MSIASKKTAENKADSRERSQKKVAATDRNIGLSEKIEEANLLIKKLNNPGLLK